MDAAEERFLVSRLAPERGHRLYDDLDLVCVAIQWIGAFGHRSFPERPNVLCFEGYQDEVP